MTDLQAETNIPRRTIRDWIANQEAINAYRGSAKRPTLGGQGMKEIIPFSSDQVLYMKDTWRDENVSTKI